MFLVKPAYANCPVCIVTVGGGLLIAKKLGVDDLLASIWISGLNTAIAFWIATRIKNKLWGNPILWSLFFFATTIIYFIWSKQTGGKSNMIWGVNKVFLGITIGMLVFFLGVFFDKLIRYKNHGKVLFYYQKVIIPLGLLIATTIIFKFLV